MPITNHQAKVIALQAAKDSLLDLYEDYEYGGLAFALGTGEGLSADDMKKVQRFIGEFADALKNDRNELG